MHDSNLYRLFSTFVQEAFPLIEPAIKNRFFKPNNHEYAEVKYSGNGMPNITSSTFATPYRISELFNRQGGSGNIDIEVLNSYKELHSFLLLHKHFRDYYFGTGAEPAISEDFMKTVAKVYIENFLEKYYHVNKSKAWDEELFKQVYIPRENYIFAENIHFDIALPILFIQCEFDEFIVAEGCTIRRISEENHKSRFQVRSYSPSLSNALISSATHELVYSNYYIKRGTFLEGSFLNEVGYILPQYDYFFNALKIATNHSSGYGQILIYPLNWDHYSTLDLPPIHGFTVRKYPQHFDDYYWTNNSFPTINSEDAGKISLIYKGLLTSENNKIKIASRRLRYSYLRDNEEDSVLDIIIALETLLSDNERGEITHKLALRIAKLISTFSPLFDAKLVFKAVKEIYAFRSAIAHGSSKVEMKKEIKLHKDAAPKPIISLANEYLCEIIKILLENPKYLNPKEIDFLLLES